MAKKNKQPRTIKTATGEELAEELLLCHNNIMQAQAVLVQQQEKMRLINLELQQRKEKKDDGKKQ